MLSPFHFLLEFPMNVEAACDHQMEGWTGREGGGEVCGRRQMLGGGLQVGVEVYPRRFGDVLSPVTPANFPGLRNQC